MCLRVDSLRKFVLACSALVPVVLSAAPASAQRTSDNALNAAEDAFGTTIGNESIGLYTSGNARGFSPSQAGNLRIEGLYFDQQAFGLTPRLVRGSAVRVGISAQSYAFPAPTGVVDFQLRTPGDRQIVSTVLTAGPYDGWSVEVDSQFPIVTDKLSVAIGAGGGYAPSYWGQGNDFWNAALIGRWRPTESIEIVPFWSRLSRYDWESNSFIYSDTVPPPVNPRAFYGQEWADWIAHETTFGAISRADLGDDWLLRAGVFRSLTYRPYAHFNLFQNVQSDGRAFNVMLKDPPQKYGSYSGEVRLEKSFTEGECRHTVQAMLRGREVNRLFGGAGNYVIGNTRLGVLNPIAEPVIPLGVRSHDHTQQRTAGVIYGGVWRRIGELSVGVQKSYFDREITKPGTPVAATKSSPWLYNGTLTINATPDLVFYASYTRGLEEFGQAPDAAVNRGEAMPSRQTKQIDAGVRYALTPRIKLVAGVFEVAKPYFDLDTASLYRVVGDVTYRGVELSLTGQLAPGLTVVAGSVFLRARVSSDAAPLPPVPIGRTPRVSTVNVQYAPASWNGLAVDAQVENTSSAFANRANTVRVEGRTQINLGARYSFNINRLGLSDAPAMFRVQAQNVSNVFRWVFDPNGSMQPLEQRRYTASLSLDF